MVSISILVDLTQAGQGLALNDLVSCRLVAALPAWWDKPDLWNGTCHPQDLRQ